MKQPNWTAPADRNECVWCARQIPDERVATCCELCALMVRDYNRREHERFALAQARERFAQRLKDPPAAPESSSR